MAQKRRITVTVDENVYTQLRYKKNLSQYVNDLVVADLWEKNKDTLAERTMQVILNSARFRELVDRLVDSRLESHRNY